MNETLAANTRIIINSTIWFSDTFGIHTEEFTLALYETTMTVVKDYYKSRGEEFDIEKVAISQDAMLAVYEHVMALAKLAALGKLLGVSPVPVGK